MLEILSIQILFLACLTKCFVTESVRVTVTVNVNVTVNVINWNSNCNCKSHQQWIVVIVGEKPSDNSLLIEHILTTTVSVTPGTSVQISILQKCDTFSFGSRFLALPKNVVGSSYFFSESKKKCRLFDPWRQDHCIVSKIRKPIAQWHCVPSQTIWELS